MNPSTHPADQLIRDLILTSRDVTATEIEQIIERIAAAPFEQRDVRAPVEFRGITYLGEVFGDYAPVHCRCTWPNVCC